MIKQILQEIADCQAVQDEEGHEHPDQCQVYTFQVNFIQRFLLKLKRIKGLQFEYYRKQWFGIYRAHK